MAEGIKISEMNESVEVDENTYIPIIQEGKNRKYNLNKLMNYLFKLMNTYSTEERVVGTWIDGKPIYRRTVSNLNVSINRTNRTNVLNADHNEKEILKCYGKTDDNCGLMATEYRVYANKIQVVFKTIYDETLSEVTLEYTKTTD